LTPEGEEVIGDCKLKETYSEFFQISIPIAGGTHITSPVHGAFRGSGHRPAVEGGYPGLLDGIPSTPFTGFLAVRLEPGLVDG
jgi:hypothetical protein